MNILFIEIWSVFNIIYKFYREYVSIFVLRGEERSDVFNLINMKKINIC